MILKVKSIVDDLEKISYSKEGDAGIDLRASCKWVVDLDTKKREITQDFYMMNPLERILIQTGVEVEIPKGFWGNIRDRSGLAFKYGLHILAGVIDETYRGEIGVVMVNYGKNQYRLQKNERIAQLIITPYIPVEILYVDELSDTVRGAEGFGDSGK